MADVVWVGQEDAEGCALATAAMLTGQTYAAVKASVDAWSEHPHDWATEGTSHYTIDRLIARHGWFVQRRYESWCLPLEPFAPVHYASVKQPSGRGHFVVVLADGRVLDPLRAGSARLADWPKVNQLVGLVRVTS